VIAKDAARQRNYGVEEIRGVFGDVDPFMSYEGPVRRDDRGFDFRPPTVKS
jgi:hypothetical protein